MVDIAKKITQVVNIAQTIKAGDDINYEPYNIANTNIFYGIPPIPLRGLDFIRARYDAPRTRKVPCLTGAGIHVNNVNNGGFIELGLMAGCVSGGVIQSFDFIPDAEFPIFIEDKHSGGSSVVVASACRLADTPEWKREALPGIDVYRFTCPSIVIVHGIRITTG